MKLQEFLDSRASPISEDRVTILKYLEKVSDRLDVEARPRGRSFVVVDFDCGAYKGSEILTYHISKINPMKVLFDLSKLTSGHRFSFEEVEKAAIKVMKERLIHL